MELKSLYIKNYKNFKELEIGTLAPVNLIIGRNNVGKSNLLEALSIYMDKVSMKRLSEILQRRGNDRSSLFVKGNNSFEERESLLLEFVYNRDRTVFYDNGRIQIGESNSSPISLSMGLMKCVLKEEEKNGIKNLNMEPFSLNEDPQPSYQVKIAWGMFKQQKGGIIVPLDNDNLLNVGIPQVKEITCQYIYSNDPNVSPHNASLWDNIVLSPKVNYVIEALQIIDDRIDKLAFKADHQPGDRQPYITYKGSEGSYKLSTLGDGMNHVLCILLAIVNCENGICLIDELENGLHYSVQGKLWEMIFMLSEKYNIQVFVTTHSRDCIDSFIAVNKPQQGKIIRLDNRHGNIVAENYDDLEDMRFIAKNDIEIR
jgi:AAA15 family ATPase/GTPase